MPSLGELFDALTGLGCFSKQEAKPAAKRVPLAVEQRAYLNQLIAIRKQTPDQLTKYFKLDFKSNDPAIMSQCIEKLRADINYQYAHKSGGVTQPAPKPSWE
jgi:hypothetical protein